MIQRIILLVSSCLILSLSAHADRSTFVVPQKHITYNKQIISDSMMIIKFIANIVQDERLIAQLDAMSRVPNSDVMQKYSYLCTVVDWSLKDFKKIETIADHANIQNKLYELRGYQNITMTELLSMQRNNRRCVKDMIIIMQGVPNSDYLQMSLQQLFHALHEVKKEIVTLDNVSSIRAWYIYITLLFLHVMLMQGLDYIESTMHQKIDQQIVMHDLLYLTEKFKHIMLSDFTIAKGVS